MRSHGTGNLYIPVDVSGEFLHETAARLREEYEHLEVEPEVADITAPLRLSRELPAPAWFALLGSTIGNFDDVHAARLLCRVARHLRPGDGFLMGADLRPGSGKSIARLEQAYNDAAGITAAFNLNVLTVLNRELGADFDVGAFAHRAFYDPDEGRIEMHLVAGSDQLVRFPGAQEIRMLVGETIRTEISCKYDRAGVDRLFREAGMVVDAWAEDADGFFALVLGKVGS